MIKVNIINNLKNRYKLTNIILLLYHIKIYMIPYEFEMV